MQIQKVNTPNNTSFGLLYTYFLSPEHQKLIQPIFPKLAKIGKCVDIQARTCMGPAVQGKDYTIFSECIEFISKPKEGSKVLGKRVIERVFTNKFIRPDEAKLKLAREEILAAAFKAAKESLRPLTINA